MAECAVLGPIVLFSRACAIANVSGGAVSDGEAWDVDEDRRKRDRRGVEAPTEATVVKDTS